MPTSTRCGVTLSAVSMLLALAGPAPRAEAQAPQPAAIEASDGDHRIFAVVREDDVFVRSGPAESYYPFGTLQAGDVVQVVGEKYNWARVVTAGPAFREFFGYVRYAKTDTQRFRLAADGRRGRTLDRLDLLAPNLNTDFDPRDSWKRILLLPADVELIVLETTENDREIIHRTALPPTAEGWINKALLEPASEAQVLALLRQMRPETPDRATSDARRPLVAAEPDRAMSPVAGPERTAPTGELATSGPALPAPTATTALPEPIAGPPAPAVETNPSRPVVVMQDNPAVEPEKGGAAAPPPVKSAKDRFEDLENAYRTLAQEPRQSAEVQPLRNLYLKLSEESDDRAVSRYSELRAEQLQIWADLQGQRSTIRSTEQRLKMSVEEARAVRLALETSGRYVAVGRLVASTIYDGQRLPRLFRLQDPATGRTIAYLHPEDGFDLHTMLGQVIGIRGEKHYDGGLRLNLVTPRQIDLLAPR